MQSLYLSVKKWEEGGGRFKGRWPMRLACVSLVWETAVVGVACVIACACASVFAYVRVLPVCVMAAGPWDGDGGFSEPCCRSGICLHCCWWNWTAVGPSLGSSCDWCASCAQQVGLNKPCVICLSIQTQWKMLFFNYEYFYTFFISIQVSSGSVVLAYKRWLINARYRAVNWQ